MGKKAKKRGGRSGGTTVLDLDDKAEKEALQRQKEWLREKGVERKNIPKDGGCMFRAMSECIHSTQHLHLEVRRRCIGFLREHEADYSPFVDVPFDHYLHDMAKPDSWGGQLELQAISLIYKVNIDVFDLNQLQIIPIDNSFPRRCRVGFYRRHYDCLYDMGWRQKAHACQSIVYDLLRNALGDDLDVPSSYKNIGMSVWKREVERQKDEDRALAKSLEREDYKNLSGYYEKKQEEEEWPASPSASAAAKKTSTKAARKAANAPIAIPLDLDIGEEVAAEEEEEKGKAVGQSSSSPALFPQLCPPSPQTIAPLPSAPAPTNPWQATGSGWAAAAQAGALPKTEEEQQKIAEEQRQRKLREEQRQREEQEAAQRQHERHLLQQKLAVDNFQPLCAPSPVPMPAQTVWGSGLLPMQQQQQQQSQQQHPQQAGLQPQMGMQGGLMQGQMPHAGAMQQPQQHMHQLQGHVQQAQMQQPQQLAQQQAQMHQMQAQRHQQQHQMQMQMQGHPHGLPAYGQRYPSQVPTQQRAVQARGERQEGQGPPNALAARMEKVRRDMKAKEEEEKQSQERRKRVVLPYTLEEGDETTKFVFQREHGDERGIEERAPGIDRGCVPNLMRRKFGFVNFGTHKFTAKHIRRMWLLTAPMGRLKHAKMAEKEKDKREEQARASDAASDGSEREVKPAEEREARQEAGEAAVPDAGQAGALANSGSVESQQQQQQQQQQLQQQQQQQLQQQQQQQQHFQHVAHQQHLQQHEQQQYQQPHLQHQGHYPAQSAAFAPSGMSQYHLQQQQQQQQPVYGSGHMGQHYAASYQQPSQSYPMAGYDPRFSPQMQQSMHGMPQQHLPQQGMPQQHGHLSPQATYYGSGGAPMQGYPGQQPQFYADSYYDMPMQVPVAQSPPLGHMHNAGNLSSGTLPSVSQPHLPETKGS